MEAPKYHEVIKPLQEIVRGIGEYVINKIVPEDVLNGINEVITGQSAQRTAEFFKLTLRHPDGDTDVFPVNGKYDRIDFFPRLGAYIIKIYDDEAGLVCYYTDEEQARKLSEEGDLPIVERDFMYESEHEGYLLAQTTLLNDGMFGGFDEAPDGE